ncbi:MAG: aminotransferase class I/II-fold pyridoxal phosphate-dependent enzyme [Euryarchaeota archaeon]|jgi:dTDP-4-amino-4,6-dideoxygalactose transaminase|nr:aminotransferase class I/II-fold pyridoxal phosphate-dependent enzyme [Euryarchaeota archaeon]
MTEGKTMESPSQPRKLVIEGGKSIVNFNNKAFKPIPQDGIDLAVQAMHAGMMYRYQPKTKEASLTATLEHNFSQYMGVKHTVGTNSCGSAMFISLNIVGIQPGDKVLTNAFTFHAVPSVIEHARGVPVLVESNREWAMDPEDLDKKATETGAKILLMSYMRGHVPDMDAIMTVVEKHNLILIEDCAHAYATLWNGQLLGTFGQIGCFSTQSSKGLSAGEGGLFITNNDEHAAKAVLYAGSYERLWTKHYDLDPELMDRLQNQIPGYSMRMQEVTAAMLTPQIDRLAEIKNIHVSNWNLLYSLINKNHHIEIPKPLPQVDPFCDTMQFHLVDLSRAQADQFIDLMKQEGIPMQIFGARRNARDYRQWEYIKAHQDELVATIANIEFACDLSMQPHLTQDHIRTMARVIEDVLAYIIAQNR